MARKAVTKPAATVAPDQKSPKGKKVERNGPSHDEIRMAAQTMIEWNSKRKKLNDAVGTFRKGLKTSGITLGTLDAMIRMLEWTPEEQKADFEERNWFAEALRFPIGAQLELFGSAETPEPVLAQLKWRNIGYQMGVAGKGWPDEPPEGCPPECDQEFGKGHEEGSEVVRAAFLKRAEAGPMVPKGTVIADEPAGDDFGPSDDETELTEERSDVVDV